MSVFFAVLFFCGGEGVGGEEDEDDNDDDDEEKRALERNAEVRAAAAAAAVVKVVEVEVEVVRQRSIIDPFVAVAFPHTLSGQTFFASFSLFLDRLGRPLCNRCVRALARRSSSFR